VVHGGIKVTTKEAIAKAAALLAEWVEGDEFETNCGGKWYLTRLTDVLGNLLNGNEVRTKPRPKKVLRPAWEILRDEACVETHAEVSGRRSIVVGCGAHEKNLADIITDQGIERENLHHRDYPDRWFVIEEPNR
jgi:hypothetical protein